MSDSVVPSERIVGGRPDGVGGGRSCTWLSDPTLVALLRAWARQPWVAVHGNAVADRLGEMLLPARAQTARQVLHAHSLFAENFPDMKTMKRARRRRHLAHWQAWLCEEYGDFENTPVESEQQTPS